jgi:hypothetical protein
MPIEEQIQQVTHLLYRAGAAHGEYEANVLNGLYDEQWHEWYAQWAVENGLNEFLGTEVSSDYLGGLLYDLNEEHKESDKSLDWAHYTANRLVEMFG